MTRPAAARAIVILSACALAVLSAVKLTHVLASLVVDAQTLAISSRSPTLPVLSIVVALLVPLACASPLRRVSLAARWMAGFLATATLLVVMHAVGLPQPLAIGLVLFTAGIGLAYSARTAAAPTVHAGSIRIERGDLVLYGLAVVLLGAAAVHILASPIYAWDAAAFWWPKALQLQQWTPIAELTRPTYPNLGPMVWAMVSHVGGNGEASGRIVLPLAAVLSLVGVSDLARRPLRPSAISTVGAIMLLFYGAESFTNGYQDSLLAAAAGSSAIGFCLWLQAATGDRRTSTLWTSFVIAGSLGLIKSEGIVVGAMLVTAFSIVALSTAEAHSRLSLIRRLIGPLAGWSVVTAIWPVILMTHHLDPLVLQEGSFNISGLLQVPSRLLERLPVILTFVAQLMGGVRGALAVLVTAPACVAVALWVAPAVRVSARRVLTFLGLTLSLHLVFVFAAFLATNAPLAWHLDTALVRLLSQMRVVMAAGIALGLFELMHIARADRPDATSDAADLR